MPVPRAVARIQRRYFHPLIRGLVTWLPGYGLLTHTGRNSGRTYRTPLNVFTAPGGFAILIAYGQDSDWLRNVLAARGAEVVRRRRRYVLTNPRIVSGPEAKTMLPPYGRLGSKLTRSPDVLLVDAAAA
jgi:deazaflavin-dependent oxidoreductase (nitroreductase family)